jgi:hypothetical protein
VPHSTDTAQRLFSEMAHMKQVVILTLLFNLFPTTLVGQSTSCDIDWGLSILLSDTLIGAYKPLVALSGDDTVHVTWQNDYGSYRLPYARSTDGGTGFAHTRELLQDSLHYPGTASWIQIRSNGPRLYVFFLGSNATYTPVRMLVSTDAGSTWNNPVDIPPDSVREIPASAISADTLAIVYAPRGMKQILRSTDAGSSWTTTTQGFNYFARVALSPGLLHLAQIHVIGNVGEFEYRRSTDVGNTWQQSSILSTPDQFNAIDPTIAADSHSGDSLIIAAWRDTKYGSLGGAGASIIIRRGVVRPDTTIWQDEEVLTDIPQGYNQALAINESRFATAWIMDHQVAPFSQVRVSNDTTWCPAFDPSVTPTRSATGIAIALSSKAVHVVWEENQAPSPSTFRIYYRRGSFVSTSVKKDYGTELAISKLNQNYPNPFNPSTMIRYKILSRSHVTLTVYDLLGRGVATLVDCVQEPGVKTATFDGSKLASGVYFYRLKAGDFVQTRKLVLVR